MEKNAIIRPFERHIHLTEETAKAVLGEAGITRREFKGNSREYDTNETVTIAGPAGEIENVAVIGPYRSIDQAELYLGDYDVLGVNDAPVVENIVDKGALLKIIGPNGTKESPCGIISQRHIHLGPDLQEAWGVKQGEYVSVRLSGERETVLSRVQITKGAPGDAVMHMDMEECHAVHITEPVKVTVL